VPEEVKQERRGSSLLVMADATPPSRDRYVDFLRAVSIMVVVLGHWLIATIYWRDGDVAGENALDVVPGLWVATWMLQVMPIFFFVGGFSNLVTIDAIARRGGGYAEFIHGRVVRLMRPTAVFLAVWVPIAAAVDLLTNLEDDTLEGAGTLLTRPLWFLGIYMIMIAFAPAMVRLHRRRGMTALIWMVVGAAVVDVAAVGFDIAYIGYLNFAFVWLFVHQLGFFYADGSLTRAKPTHYWAFALGGLALLVALTASQIYSPSMVGLRNERSNTNPPTVVIIALTIWQLGLVMLLRQRITQWLSRRRVWAIVIGLNGVIMTIFLWHQTAMIGAVAAIYPLGFPQPKSGAAQWWFFRPVWILVLLVFLAVLVFLLGRLERGPKAARTIEEGQDSWQKTLMAAVGTTYVLIGILGFAVSGLEGFASSEGDLLVMFSVNPLLNVIHLAFGGLLLRASISGIAPMRLAAVFGAGAFAILGVAGLLLLVDAGSSNVLALNGADCILYLGTAALLASVATYKSGRIETVPA
jgi:fucose 4-O-acetylase-like acetyltransferase